MNSVKVLHYYKTKKENYLIELLQSKDICRRRKIR